MSESKYQQALLFVLILPLVFLEVTICCLDYDFANFKSSVVVFQFRVVAVTFNLVSK
jgi:hypothetical protein